MRRMVTAVLPALLLSGLTLPAVATAQEGDPFRPGHGLGVRNYRPKPLYEHRPSYPERIPRDMRVPPRPNPGRPRGQSEPLLPQGFTMNRTWIAQSGPVAVQARELDRPRDIADRLSSCWRPPALKAQREVTIRLAFRRDGRPIAEPRITYTAGARNDVERNGIRASILKAVRDCGPLRFTPGLASAIAGRPITIRFIAPVHPVQAQHSRS